VACRGNTIQIDLIAEDTVAVTFPYDAGLVKAIKTLDDRRWNPKERRWEVHLSHLEEILRLFALDRSGLDARILEQFERSGVRQPLTARIGPLEGQLSGGGIPLADIDQVTSYFVPGYKFSPKYKAKKWDGKRRLFDRRKGTFPAGLWSTVRRVLEERKIPFEVVEEGAEGTDEASPMPPFHGEPTPLRPYQEKVVDDAIAARRGIIQIATGGGKTLIAAHLIRRIARPTFFFVHTLDLLYQTQEVLHRELGQEVGILGDGQARPGPVTVATIQTAARAFEAGPRRASGSAKASDEEVARAERPTRLDESTRQHVREAIEQAGLVIFDECHHVPADTFYKIAMRTRSAAWRYGLSATPWRDDACDLLLEAALGEKISAINCSDLIEGGYLVAPRLRMTRCRIPRGIFRARRYPEIYQQAIVENQERNRMIAARATQWAAEGRSVLVLVAQVAHGRLLHNLLPEANFAYGALDSEVRWRCLKELEQKLRPVLIATTLADEGLDVPTLDAVILAGGGKSQSRAYQRIGRALRPAPGKTEALVMDFVDNVPYLRDHSEARLALYRQEPAFHIEQ